MTSRQTAVDRSSIMFVCAKDEEYLGQTGFYVLVSKFNIFIYIYVTIYIWENGNGNFDFSNFKTI